jgi:hypothetical protein
MLGAYVAGAPQAAESAFYGKTVCEEEAFFEK